MITIATLLWDANAASAGFSRMYHESWVTRLYEGFARNLSMPFRFVLFTDRARDLPPEITQEQLRNAKPTYADCIEPYRLNMPMILIGLDTVITGPVNHLVEYCMVADKIALPRDPYHLERASNGVALVPAGQRRVFDDWKGQNDLEWMQQQPHVDIDALFPGQIVSYKGHVKKHGLGDARICYFHGREKPHELTSEPWIRKHWLGEHG
jgi:hypothetical protein